jgi:hypothetical protein
MRGEKMVRCTGRRKNAASRAIQLTTKRAETKRIEKMSRRRITCVELEGDKNVCGKTVLNAKTGKERCIID